MPYASSTPRSPDQRRADHRAKHGWRLVDRAHRFDDAEHGRDDAQCRERIGERLEIVGGADGFMVMGFDRVIHDVLDRVRIEIARRHDDETQCVTNQVNQRGVLQKAGIVSENRRGLGILDMWLDRDRAVDAEHFHELRHKENGVEEILLFPAWPLEHFDETAAQRL
jgi:hypothetical protein